ncbi:aldehyde dehydrogenase family protein [Antribacter gilvus]|uniref:aldehyde dehydrogenase family protein n=1 Tax=Antribacter gilvus TaxID=2304675 RepID=UPI000F77EC08|nr:aldehyde dehydrogenase family protein [Antribacter gilvus]
MSVTDARALTSHELDDAIDRLAVGAERWAHLPHDGRARLLREVGAAVAGVAERWMAAACRAKSVPVGSELEGEEWLTGPYAALTAVAGYARAYDAVAAGGSTLAGSRLQAAPGGRVAVRVLPENAQEGLMFHGFHAEVWMPPGVTAEQVRRDAGPPAPTSADRGGVCLVLGAGNISSIAPLDALYELVAHDRASIVKLNPTFTDLLPVYEEAFAPLVAAGVLRFVTGGAETGARLTAHDGIAKVHITGSVRTHDAIVWGTGEEARRRRAEDDPRLTVPITSELGGVAPVIVVPGRWSRADLRFQAEHVATMRLHNAGHNCIAGQVLVLSAGWPQKDAFLDEVRAVLARLPARAPWYPGAAATMARVAADHAGAEEVNGRLLVRVEPGDAACADEYFAPVLAWTELPGEGASYLRAAVGLANDGLAGTLGANMIVRPADRRALGAAFDQAVADLRYGTVAINAWTGMGFLLPRATWGAFPGHTRDGSGSGTGVVHNGHLLRDPERTVLTGPFRPFPRSVLHGEPSLFPKPPWFVGARSGVRTARALTAYAAAPSWGRLATVLVHAFRA